MNQSRYQSIQNQQPDPKVRMGCFPARIGMQHAHRIGVSIPLAAPERPVATIGAIGAARTTINRARQNYQYGANGHPLRALPGATVYLEVQDFSRLEPELAEKVRWVCTHHNCAGKHFGSPEELIQSHPPDAQLRDEVEIVYGTAVRGRPHMYMGVLEIAGADGAEAQPAKKNEKGEITHKAVEGRPAIEPTVMLLSTDY